METKKENWNAPKSNFNKSYSRNYEASPLFDFKNKAIIGAGETWVISIANQKPEAQKYLPFTCLRLVNSSAHLIAMFPNESEEGMPFPSGAIVTFDRKTLPALRSLKITNMGAGDIAIDELMATFWKEAVQYDQAFSKIHKAFFKVLNVGGV
jgi:hypothetical protein